MISMSADTAKKIAIGGLIFGILFVYITRKKGD